MAARVDDEVDESIEQDECHSTSESHSSGLSIGPGRREVASFSDDDLDYGTDEADSDLDIDAADWEQTGRGTDFTKQYNKARGTIVSHRLRGQVATPVSNSPSNQALIAQKRKDATQAHFGSGASKAETKASSDIISDRLAELAPFAARVSLSPFQAGVSRKGDSSIVNREKDKSDRATTEQVLDPRTRVVLFKMIRRNVIHQVNGVISTGKEAGVYHATMHKIEPYGTSEWNLAIKIYKTSILTFKDRDRYVTGERRFKQGYSRHNPRKMVQLWAEKEMRNLKRLWHAGIPCPEPLLLRLHILVMGFLGDAEGWACPRLKDAHIGPEKWPSLYRQMMRTARRLYQECHLVHADLSEYNILYSPDLPSWRRTPFTLDPLGDKITHNLKESSPQNRTPLSSSRYEEGTLYIIDVSQSVEYDHPHAQAFLKKDLQNIQDFFAKRLDGTVLDLRRSFAYVTSPHFDGRTDAEELEMLLASTAPESTNGSEVLFAKEYIPRSLHDVIDAERDTALVQKGRADELNYQSALLPATEAQPEASMSQIDADADPSTRSLNEQESQDSEEDDSESDITDSDSQASREQEFQTSQPGGIKNLDKDANRERKKILKEEARERRKVKMSKSEKKKKLKKHSGKR